MKFDWHRGEISRAEVDADYRSTRNVRRFLSRECGTDFKFNRAFMAWINNGNAKNMGDVADEWMRTRMGSG